MSPARIAVTWRHDEAVMSAKIEITHAQGAALADLSQRMGAPRDPRAHTQKAAAESGDIYVTPAGEHMPTASHPTACWARSATHSRPRGCAPTARARRPTSCSTSQAVSEEDVSEEELYGVPRWQPWVCAPLMCP